MLLLTYSYVVPKEKRTEHARLLNRMRQVMHRLGCDQFEAFEQVGKGWVGAEATGRVVQILRFRDKQHFAHVQAGEKTDPGAQSLIAEFCELINLPYQQQTGLFADGFYNELPVAASSGAQWTPPAMTAAAASQTQTDPEPATTVPLEPSGAANDHVPSGDSPDELVSHEPENPPISDLPITESLGEEPAPVSLEDEPDDMPDLSRLAPEGENDTSRNGEDVIDFLNDTGAEDSPREKRE